MTSTIDHVTAPATRIVVRDALDGHVLYEAVGALGEGDGDEAGRNVVEHDLAVPAGSVVVLATGGRREAIAGAVAAVLAVRPADVTARLVALPAIAAFDLDRGAASSVVRAIELAGGRAVAV